VLVDLKRRGEPGLVVRLLGDVPEELECPNEKLVRGVGNLFSIGEEEAITLSRGQGDVEVCRQKEREETPEGESVREDADRELDR
jgi:hypothetical protein